MAFQADMDGYNVYEPGVISQSFEVVFAPLPLESPLQTFFIDDGETAEVKIIFQANPPPSNEQVVWHIVKQSSNHSRMITAGEIEERFEAKYIEVEGTEVTAVLLIHEASFEKDLLSYCYLEASNELGRFEYGFSLEPRPVTTPEPSTEEVCFLTLSYLKIIPHHV